MLMTYLLNKPKRKLNMSESKISVATITITVIGDATTHLERFLEQCEHYKTMANYVKPSVEITYSNTIKQLSAN